MRPCRICGREALNLRTVCSFHKKNPTKDAPRPYIRGLADRLAFHSEPTPSGCQEWTGMTYRNGYGKITVEGRTRIVHRVAYEHHVGPIAPGMELDHLCMNRKCIAIDHLEPVTSYENKRRQANPRDAETGRFVAKVA